MYPDEDLPVLDYTKLRYALYVRKSTDDGEKQQRSLDDQIAECEILARRLGIRLVKPYLVEKRSAKIPDQRPVFAQLMKDLREGTYDGIVAWHPDRLARNMLEGGAIIHMVDIGVIKDLRFVTHYFTNDANGKLILGTAFVLSKHYSDDLSQKVTRGVRRSFREGKSAGTPKYGYLRDEHGIYRHDGKNFELICEAWQMRRKGATYAEIKHYLDSNGYGRRIKGTHAKRKGHVLKVNIKQLTDMFRDPFYYGVLVQAGKHVDLRAVPGYGFRPAVSEQDWQCIQAMTSRHRNVKGKERTTFYPLKHMVLCSFCQRTMYVGASKGHGGRYLYYRCLDFVHFQFNNRRPKTSAQE